VNIASLELCRDLFELSGWGQSETHLTYYDGSLDETEPWDRGADNRKCIPAYDLGYLLRNLPQNSWVGYVDTSGRRGYALAKTYAWNEKGTDIDKIAECRADTPENAAVMLAIELFKRGILKRR
jgi:hypothetical protein